MPVSVQRKSALQGSRNALLTYLTCRVRLLDFFNWNETDSIHNLLSGWT
jgi:hypothetical protein